MTELELTVEDFPVWFTDALSVAVKTDLKGIRALLVSIQTTISNIHALSVSLRDIAAVQPQSAAQLSARCIKLCDQLDSVVQQFGAPPPVLAGMTYIAELCQRLKNRIKTVDDMASSSKLTKSDEAVQTKLTSLRALFHDLQERIEDLESLHLQKSVVTEFVDEVKGTLDGLVRLLEERTKLSGGKASRERILELQGSVASYRSRGTSSLASPALQRHVVLQELRARLEMALADMLSPIHALFNQSSAQVQDSGLMKHPLLRSLMTASPSSRDALHHAEFRARIEDVSKALSELLTSDSFPSAVETSALTPSAAAAATALAFNAEGVIACIAEWRDVLSELDSLEASAAFRSAQAEVTEAAARVRTDEQTLVAATKALAHDRDRRRVVETQMEGLAQILLTVCLNDLGIAGIRLKL